MSVQKYIGELETLSKRARLGKSREDFLSAYGDANNIIDSLDVRSLSPEEGLRVHEKAREVYGLIVNGLDFEVRRLQYECREQRKLRESEAVKNSLPEFKKTLQKASGVTFPQEKK